MEQGQSFESSQPPETSKTTKKNFFVIFAIALIVIIFSLWFFVFGGKNIINPEQKELASQISDKSDICQIHVEYCKETGLLESFKSVKPVFVADSYGNDDAYNKCFVNENDKAWTISSIKNECLSKPIQEKEVSSNTKAVLKAKRKDTTSQEVVFFLEPIN